MTHLQKIHISTLLRPFVSIQRLMKRLNYPVIMPFYHTVSDEKLPYISELYTLKNTKQFTDDLDLLLQHFEPVAVEDIIHNRLKPDKPYMLLSFDDGLKESHSVIAPLLKSKGIPAAFFVNPAFIDDADWFYRYEAAWLINEIKHQPPSGGGSCSVIKMHENEALRLQQMLRETTRETRHNIDKVLEKLNLSRDAMHHQTRIYLTKKELISLHNDGFHIGTHSMHHPPFSELSSEEQTREVKEGFQALRDIIQTRHKSFAFPFTDDGVSDKQMMAIYNAAKPDISFGTSGIGKRSEIPHYQRIPMEHEKSFTANSIIKSELIAYRMKKLLNKA
ncbi:MAG: polysaccharide deacetylase family protein [Bacteroidota bacterium]